MLRQYSSTNSPFALIWLVCVATMKSTLSLVALTSLVGSTVADDYLFSSRYALNKRDIDSEGNWNVCMYTLSRIFERIALTVSAH